MNTRIWESDCIPKDKELSKQTLDNTPRTPTNTPRHEALMRRPRTPTLGRAALLARAGYSSTERAELAGKVNERLERTTASPICGTALSRSSSINQELSENTVNPLET
ncbi:hypothetical protein FGIG_11172 [Fasciola gigantica]|uniref:Uncharacterized protein n=1 Tax=Fasciola gigantica TaxID=46835 RepID=A0A504Z1K7_FASGI|nr:hypothetical protein FGIG_11172 [Fasciola gigantica]